MAAALIHCLLEKYLQVAPVDVEDVIVVLRHARCGAGEYGLRGRLADRSGWITDRHPDAGALWRDGVGSGVRHDRHRAPDARRILFGLAWRAFRHRDHAAAVVRRPRAEAEVSQAGSDALAA